MGNNCQCLQSDAQTEMDLSQHFFNRLKNKNNIDSQLKVIEVSQTTEADTETEESKTIQPELDYRLVLFKLEKENELSIKTLMNHEHSPLRKGRGKVIMEQLLASGEFCLKTLKKLREDNNIRKNEYEIRFQQFDYLGPFELENKQIYYGQFNNGNKEGFGYQIWPDESIYEGYWLQNKTHFYGRMIYTDGDYYEGEWVADLMDGKGVFVSHTGFTYIGEFRENEPEGYGEERWLNGSYYKGIFAKGIKNGQGEFCFSNKIIYKGKFENNMFNGIGKLTFPNGNYYKGNWVDNKIEGKGVFKWNGLAKYVGEFKDNKKHGKGELKLANGKKIEGVWVDSKLKNKFTLTINKSVFYMKLNEKGDFPFSDVFTKEDISAIKKCEQHTMDDQFYTTN